MQIEERSILRADEERALIERNPSQVDISNVERIIYPIFSRNDDRAKTYWKAIRSSFLEAMKHAGINFMVRNLFWFYVNRTITRGMKRGLPLAAAEETLRKFLRRHPKKQEQKRLLSIDRAKRSFELIKNFITGESVLDLGGGNGLLAKEIEENLGKDVLLLDVVDYNLSGLPVLLCNPGERIPVGDGQVDTTVLYTVLHHSNDPVFLLNEAARVTKKRLVIMEADIEDDAIRAANCFFDWFYNRVIGDEDINVPLNFLTVQGWGRILEEFGFKIVEVQRLGINEPVVPEHQVLIIADVK